jgi:two-component system OmpR family sensor kinase
MGRIESEAIRMSLLVESLLTLARLDENQKLEAAPTDLAKVIRDLIANDVPGKQKMTLTMLSLSGAKLPEDFKLEAEVNDGQILQVLVNLIENAKRFSEPKSQIEIAIGQKNEGEVIFEVIDHGEGIPKQLRDKVFERFYRADSSRNRDTGGTGLGLAIVKEIVALHKGRIEVKETPGGGATFRVKLPTTHNWV